MSLLIYILLKLGSNETIHSNIIYRKEKEVRTTSWDSFTFRSRTRKDNTKSKSSEMEDRSQQSVVSQKPRRRECSTESNAVESLNCAER